MILDIKHHHCVQIDDRKQSVDRVGIRIVIRVVTNPAGRPAQPAVPVPVLGVGAQAPDLDLHQIKL